MLILRETIVVMRVLMLTNMVKMKGMKYMKMKERGRDEGKEMG